MDRLPKWLPEPDQMPWETLAAAMRNGLPVPAGYLAVQASPEHRIRAAYEELKAREYTHFVAVRGPSHAVLNVIGPDALVHTLHRFWAEAPDATVLVQRMIYAMWCGKAQTDGRHLFIRANEGMMLLDPDTYTLDPATGKCVQCVLQPKQRKMIRHVDGSAKVVERNGARTPMPAELLERIAALAARAGANVGWAIDDLDKIWLLSVDAGPMRP
jgi:hypothetical protein